MALTRAGFILRVGMGGGVRIIFIEGAGKGGLGRDSPGTVPILSRDSPGTVGIGCTLETLLVSRSGALLIDNGLYALDSLNGYRDGLWRCSGSGEGADECRYVHAARVRDQKTF